ncbi:MAG TPA: hypothetical protein ENH85_01180 [Candidatus Scalindua sp.]|nr:hypothetical protein [Candidatus Scalindua sp.]
MNDTINKFGSIFRFITPFLLGIALFILGAIRTDIAKVEARFDKRCALIEKNYVHRNEYKEAVKRIDENLAWIRANGHGRK